jgi:hypothetical protein
LILEYLRKEPKIDGSLKIERIARTHTHTCRKPGLLQSLYQSPKRGCVTRGVALPFTLKSILRRQKEEELWKIQNISPCKNILIFKKKIL